jgi:hypothetical protein
MAKGHGLLQLKALITKCGGRRFINYSNYSFLTHPANNKMVISKAIPPQAILPPFSPLSRWGGKRGGQEAPPIKLEILEYCDSEYAPLLIKREQYYLDLLVGLS